jgi:hypothetical protein
MKCSHKKKTGEICKNNALLKDKYCWWHSKKIPEKEKSKARSDGGKNKLIKVNGNFEYYELEKITDVSKLNSVLINSVLSKNLDLRIATGICYLLNLQLKILEVENIEKRISLIEDKILENKNYES